MNLTPESTAESSERYEVVLDPWEARMSLWVDTPSIIERASGRTIFSFRDVRWSLNRSNWLSQGVVELRLRKYPGSHSPGEVSATIDCDAGAAQVGGAVVPIAVVESQLDTLLAWPSSGPVEPAKGLIGWIKRLMGASRA